MIITEKIFSSYSIGAKAERLFRMRMSGVNVPELVCVKEGFSEAELLSYIRSNYEEGTTFSVRSSASSEDGGGFSFAGQFRTFLSISAEKVADYAKKCLDPSVISEVKAYCEQKKINTADIELTAIIQVMVEADFSGVIFTSNPQGILNETVIAVGKGTGNNVVEDRTAVTQYYCNLSDNTYYFEKQEASPEIDRKMLDELLAVSEQIVKLFGEYQDIEFAIKDNILYILQARPITSIEKNCNKIILDSSNISESYPGISLPMTVSFVDEVYYEVFRSCIRRLTKNDGTAERLDEVLRHMTDNANGRIYYRISGWYDVIMLLPFSKKIIPVWQEMLGVRDKSVSSSSGKAGFATKFRVVRSFFSLLLTNRKKMKKLNDYFDTVYKECRASVDNTGNPSELLKIYSSLKASLASEWDLTLVNDMYSFIYTGLLKSRLKRKNPENYQELTNRYISGISGIESMKPIKLLNRISSLRKSGITDTNELCREYIKLYGDRCPSELKLETKTCRTNPELLEEKINSAASPIADYSKPPQLRGISGFFAKRAAAGIALREHSRLSRAKIFGLVRSIVLKIADNFYDNGRIDSPHDIFYLSFNELFEAVEKPSLKLREIISAQKKRYEMFYMLPQVSRIIYADEVFDKHHTNINSVRVSSEKNVIQGIPCSSGTVEGEIILVDEINDSINAEGRIIVAKMTDPGWVFLLSRSKGIISEKGSLLSHTAIISRELKIPSVVGAENICDILRNGDYVRLNGRKGTITILEKSD